MARQRVRLGIVGAQQALQAERFDPGAKGQQSQRHDHQPHRAQHVVVPANVRFRVPRERRRPNPHRHRRADVVTRDRDDDHRQRRFQIVVDQPRRGLGSLDTQGPGNHQAEVKQTQQVEVDHRRRKRVESQRFER
jgi:hypothetical protein